MITAKKLKLVIPRHHAWPPLDQAAWDAATRSGGLFDAQGALSRHQANQLPVFEAAYGRWLGFLAVHQPGLAIESGLDHFDQGRVQAFYERLNAALAPCTVRVYMTSLWTVVRAMAPENPFRERESGLPERLLGAAPGQQQKSDPERRQKIPTGAGESCVARAMEDRSGQRERPQSASPRH